MILAKRSPALNFAVALGVSVLALAVSLSTPLRTSSPFLVFVAAVLISTRFGGWGPGVFATLLATAASLLVLFPLNGAPGLTSLDDAVRLAAFDLIALFVIVVVSRDRTAWRKSEQHALRLTAALAASEDAFVTITLGGTIQTWNPSAERLMRYSAGEVIGKSIQIIYPPDRPEEFENTVARLKRGESINHFDTVRVAKDGRRVDVSIGEKLMRDAQGNVVGVSTVMRDITERKRAETAARFLAEVSNVLASSLDYKTTLASVARLAVPHIADWCAVHVKAEDGSIQRLALSHVELPKEDLALELQRLYLDDPNAPFGVSTVIKTGKPELFARFVAEQNPGGADELEPLRLLTNLGLKSLMVVPLIAPGRTFGAITFVSAESGRTYDQADLMLAQDLAHRAALAVDNARLYHRAQSLNEELDQRVAERTAELQMANQQLRLLAGHLQSAVEEERIRIARTIHDEVGTLMTAIKMDLAFLGREIGGNGSKKSPDQMREEIGATTKLVDEAIESVHQIARELRPGVLDHLGLRAALEWQMQEFQDRYKIECHFSSDLDELDLDLVRSTAVFRIMQEALTNVARHAQATRAQASLHKQDRDLILEVRDNGKGISESPDTNRFGILGMRERAHVFGGEVTLHGVPGQGTVVTVRIPL